MKKILTLVLISALFGSIYASDVRVITMGRSDNFFMDDISIYRNPANINVYPNMMLGSIGFYRYDSKLDDTIQSNRDPQKPYFGGILSYSLNQSEESVQQYPMISFAAVINRYDPMLKLLDETSPKYFGEIVTDTLLKNNVETIDPLGKVDVMAGVTLKNGGMIGVGTYIALNKEEDLNNLSRKTTKLVKGNVGVNMPMSKAIDFEASFTAALYSKIGTVRDTTDPNTSAPISMDSIVIANNDIGIDADVRVFSALSGINGDIVPHVGFKLRKFHANEHTILGFNGGLGLNIYIDRGFFWAGIEGTYEDNDYAYSSLLNKYTTLNEITGRVSFGIERNVLWDWFVIRAGGTKNLIYRKVDGNKGFTYWSENPEADGSDEDHLGIGVGINVENRLKIDATIAENIFYTFSNLFSGNSHHIFTRISASFSF